MKTERSNSKIIAWARKRMAIDRLAEQAKIFADQLRRIEDEDPRRSTAADRR